MAGSGGAVPGAPVPETVVAIPLKTLSFMMRPNLADPVPSRLATGPFATSDRLPILGSAWVNCGAGPPSPRSLRPANTPGLGRTTTGVPGAVAGGGAGAAGGVTGV